MSETFQVHKGLFAWEFIAEREGERSFIEVVGCVCQLQKKPVMLKHLVAKGEQGTIKKDLTKHLMTLEP